jgi:hypothetical protein
MISKVEVIYLWSQVTWRVAERVTRGVENRRVCDAPPAKLGVHVRERESCCMPGGCMLPRLYCGWKETRRARGSVKYWSNWVGGASEWRRSQSGSCPPARLSDARVTTPYYSTTTLLPHASLANILLILLYYYLSR